MKFCECGRMLLENIDGTFSCRCGKNYGIDGGLIKDVSEIDSKDKKVRSVHPNMGDDLSKNRNTKQIEEHEFENKINNKSRDDVIKCPNCGSTQITILRKKWSPLTGIFTNKVERVCLNCKKRF